LTTALVGERLARWIAPLGLLVLALAVRLPGLGTFLTPDEFLWVDRSRNFMAGLLNPAYVCESLVNHTGFEQAMGLGCTLRTGHPGVTTMWTGSLGFLLRYLDAGQPGSLFDFVTSQTTNPLDAALIVPERLPSVLLISVWVVGVYWLVKRLLNSEQVALLAGVFLALDPFHIALSRVIHHDALATAFMTLSLLAALIYWLRGGRRTWLIASGLLAGLAFLSKSTALFLNPFVAVFGLWWLIFARQPGEPITWRRVGSAVRDGLLWFTGAALAFVVCWPAMWVMPLDVLRTVFTIGFKYASSGHAKGNFFLGSVSNDPGALFYPVSWLLRSSPLAWAGLTALGWLAWRSARSTPGRAQPRWQPNRVWPILAWLAVYVVAFLAFMTMGEKKQDRYLLPVYPVLSIMAAAGLTWVWKARYHWLLLSVVLVQAGLVIANYPYYFTYYNPLLGGVQGAQHMVTVGWGEGLDVAADYLNQKPGVERLRVAAWYQSTFAPFFRGQAISYAKEKGKALSGQYVVFYINQLQRRFPDDELFRYFEERYQPETVIRIKGVDYVVIYPGPGMQHYVEDRVDEDRRVYRGIAALLGWDWLTPAAAETYLGPQAPGSDPNVPIAVGGSQLPFRLYWEYLGKAPEERFFFRLLTGDGRKLSEGISQPLLSEAGDPLTWRQGQIITEQGELPIPAHIPSGDYPIQIGFYTRAPAVPEGELIFDLPPEEAWVRVEAATSGARSSAEAEP